ncbi:Elongation factor 2 [Entamoeba marina]
MDNKHLINNKLLCNKNNIRNVSIVSLSNDVNNSLISSFYSHHRILSQTEHQVDKNESSSIDKEEDINIIRTISFPMWYQLNDSNIPNDAYGNEFLINLINLTNIFYSLENIICSLRLVDGVLIVVDCLRSIDTQIQSILRQTYVERVQPIIFINTIDRMVLELKQSPEDIYQTIYQSIGKINTIISTFNNPFQHEIHINPKKNNISFGSSILEFAFTIEQFAKMLSTKYGISKDILVERLWGDNYWDPFHKTWIGCNKGGNGRILQRSFVEFCLNPIIMMFNAIIEGRHNDYDEMLKKLKITLPFDDRDKEGIDLLHVVMKLWLPIDKCLLEMIIIHLPSPVIAQTYQTEMLYTGDLNDEIAMAMKQCDENGPLMIYVSKMIPHGTTNKFYAFGRIFSGTIQTKKKVRICDAKYMPKQHGDCVIKPIKDISLFMGGGVESIEECPCGNIIALSGLDKYLKKSGTITDSDSAHVIKEMIFSFFSIVRVCVEPINPIDLPQLIGGINALAKMFHLSTYYIDGMTDEYMVIGDNEFHVSMLLRQLQMYCKDIPLNISEPSVSFRETIRTNSSIQCFSKTANKQSKFYMKAIPFPNGLSEDIENHIITSNMDSKERANILNEKYQWDVGECRKIWCFGPDELSPNLLVDTTKCVKFLNEAKNFISIGFNMSMSQGVICNEEVRGVRINLEDVRLHADPPHRGSGQLIPCARRCCYACILTASPTLLEPIFLVEIQCLESSIGGIYVVLNKRKGTIISQEQCLGIPLFNIKAYLPGKESIGIINDIQLQTSKKFYYQIGFSHWSMMKGDINDITSEVGKQVREIRRRKGLPEFIHTLDKYHDGEIPK